MRYFQEILAVFWFAKKLNFTLNPIFSSYAQRRAIYDVRASSVHVGALAANFTEI